MSLMSTKNVQDANLILKNWQNLTSSILLLSEADLERLMKIERDGKHRPAVLLRMYGRFAKLRNERERRNLLS